MKRIIRLARASDAEGILTIYAPYISGTAISFETEVPSAEEFATRIGAIGGRYPYLVCEIDGKIAGYAYASKFREREAYRYDVETSIYVAAEYHGSGLAYELYGRLFQILKELGYYNAYASTVTQNTKSVNFHQKFGFKPIGIYHRAGYKFERWHDGMWLEKEINSSDARPGRIRAIRDLPVKELEEILR